MVGADKLRGFVGQGLDGRKAVSSTDVYLLRSSVNNFTIPKTGRYRLVLWGGGGPGGSVAAGAEQGGGSGAYVEAERLLQAGAVLAISIGVTAAATTVTLPTGEVLTAGGGVGGLSGGAGGVATAAAFDVKYNGSPGGTTGGAGTAGKGSAGGAGGVGGSSSQAGGGGAPGNGTHMGGAGGSPFALEGNHPGGGGAFNAGSTGAGGRGELVIYRVG